MKLLSILFNIASLGCLAYLMIEKGMPRNDEFPIVIIFAGAAILSLIVIITAKDSSYIGLWLQRKKLEEQNKIDQLNKTKP
ncbi:hypothetical protein ATI02_4356 [Pseudomonas baetica]|uniref:Uncharacterized protein n=1 Tax=Pseudomonas baetica TaxID=674054 RepID=A0ABX4Q3L6_9PSED|nr:hypothetical protein [Pseudomonas baetica]PKA71378.1 hypothetical protein ATI02_4356 [Pseudomonas baetica]PTC19875.1 hypothetical protein C0J26_07715 [Pseudomonas baetica]